jgi:cell division protein FtsZ
VQHPLLESISLEIAAGVFAYFTGGDDLTLMEVQEALEGLQSQTGSQTEIVLGVTNDDSMVNRAQVILLITGLGGPTLEDAFSQVQKTNPVKQAPPVQEHRPQEKVEPPYVEPAVVSPGYSKTTATNYDIPAFLRRRNL